MISFPFIFKLACEPLTSSKAERRHSVEKIVDHLLIPPAGKGKQVPINN